MAKLAAVLRGRSCSAQQVVAHGVFLADSVAIFAAVEQIYAEKLRSGVSRGTGLRLGAGALRKGARVEIGLCIRCVDVTRG